MVAGLTQLVECNLPKVEVAGSNPVSRSRYLQGATIGGSSEGGKGRSSCQI